MQWQRVATYRLAAALRSTDRQGEGMAEKSADVICIAAALPGFEKMRNGNARSGMATARQSDVLRSKGKALRGWAGRRH